MTERESQILEILRRNPLVSQKELASQLGIQRSSVAVHITNLVKKGYIKGKGYILEDTDYAVVIGGVNMDVTGFTDKPLIERDSNPGKINITPGGVGRNIAQNLTALGIATKLISVVGDDLLGEKIIEDCSQTGIDTSLVKRIPGQSSSLYLAILDDTGDMKLAISDMQIMKSLTIEQVKLHHSVIENAAAIIVDTNLSGNLLSYLAETYKNRLILDTVSTTKTTKVIGNIGSFRVIKPNRQEAELLVGFKIETPEQAKKAVSALLEKGVETVVITLGREGVVYGTVHSLGEYSLPQRIQTNTTGAGDAFLATLVYCQLHAYDIDKSVKLASVAASLTAQSDHSSNPGLSEETLLTTFNNLNL